jgi:hypothetical protein
MSDTADLSAKREAIPPAEESAASVYPNTMSPSLADDLMTDPPSTNETIEIQAAPAETAGTAPVPDDAWDASGEQALSEVDEQVRINMEQILAATQLDIEAETACRLARTAAGNGRDVYYIPAVIEAVLRDARLRSRGAAFIQRINSNWDLPSPN